MPEMSEAKKRANKKWNDENLSVRYDHIHLALPAGYKEQIQAAAKQESIHSRDKVSVNEFIRKAIDKRIEEVLKNDPE